ncbi:putative membrane protein [Geodermatophilus bullaregiensis]|uniref:O-antigen ligase family protein n=1 Tax=Geodermatophilus bullaregiensis TaxID=1564160 RepID=UPI00195BEA00|nr:O-antigen ligase family protein [Geodermatophilus bullaregiensis]MBM7806998.1 putative membrane protein [Geodermatophilus bullaregiensis]
MTIYSAGYLALHVPLRFAMVYLLLGVIIMSRRAAGVTRSHVAVAVAAYLTSALVVAYGLGWVTWWSATTGERVVRYALLFTCAFWAGTVLRQTGHARLFFRIYLLWSTVMSALATVEFALNRNLVDRSDFVSRLERDGHLRAALLSEHPIVLSALLLVALPAAMRLGRVSWRLSTGTLLLAGIYCTQSRGALVAGLVYLVVQLLTDRSWQGATRSRSLLVPATVLMVAAIAVGLLISPPGIEATVTSSDGAQSSVEYRGVLYSLISESLSARPLGWGFAGLPHGVYLIPSPVGVLDVADTVDSELVLLVFEYGLIGLGLFVLVASLCVDRVVRASDVPNDAFALLVFVSLFLAIHAWTGVGALAFILLSCAVHGGRQRPTGAPIRSDGVSDPAHG